MSKESLLSEKSPSSKSSVAFEPLWKRVLPLCAITITTFFSVGIGVLSFTGYRNTGWLYDWSLHGRSSLQIVTFLVSTALGLIWTYTVCTIINFETRLYLKDHTRSMNWIRTSASLSMARIDWYSPIGSFIITTLFLGLSTVPAILWTGSLTAQAVTTNFNSSIALPLLLTGNESYWFLGIPSCEQYQRTNGTFSNCPQEYLLSQLLQAASSATMPDKSTTRNHTKPDHTKYQYVGRSYGVGSSIGLTDTNWTLSPDSRSYIFQEQGFQSSVNCIYNESALWHIALEEKSSGNLPTPSIFVAEGAFPNSNWTEIYEYDLPAANDSAPAWSDNPGIDWYATVGLDNTDGIVAVGAKASAGQYFVNFAAGTSYSALDKIQCELTFHPTTFAVNVSIADSTIVVTPLADPKAPDPADSLLSYLVNPGLNVTAKIFSPYTSLVGDSFMSNIASANLRSGASDPNNPPPSNATVLTAVSASLEAVLDDLAAALGATALLFPNTTAPSPAPAVVTRAAAGLGAQPYAAGLIALYGAALLAAYALAARSRLWRDCPAFDHADLPSLAGAAARGGAVAGAGRLEGWRGGAASDPALGRARAELVAKKGTDEQPCMVLL